jgi:hypothetical protein
VAPPPFRLGPGQRYTSVVLGLRLAESFDSLADWQRTHPQAATAAAAQPAATPQQVAPAPGAAPGAGARSGHWGWVAWLLGAAAALAALLALRRRARPEPAPQFVATSASASVTAVSSPAPAQDEAAAPIRERLLKLSRAKLDQDLARRALLVDAFLDLKRYDSAERLLNELEQDLADGGEPRPGVATVAAAVRRQDTHRR